MNYIHSNIKFLRERQGLSKVALGEKLEVTRQQIANYELGNGTIPLKNAIELSEIFNVTLDELVKYDLSNHQGALNRDYLVSEPAPEYGKSELEKCKIKIEAYERVFRLMGIKKPDL